MSNPQAASSTMISFDEENFEKKNHVVKAMKVNSVHVIFGQPI